jgi:hypothetical protein
MSVGASGTAPLLYQWQALGTNIPGATNALLSLTNVQLSQAGPYRATVFNSAGAVTSAVALLTILDPPSIVTQPQGKVVPVGTNLTLNVSALGNGILRYQWRLNSQPIDGATNSSLAFLNIQETNSGDYTVVVSDLVGSITSESATVLALTKPAITQSPQAVTAVVGDTVTLQVSASGSLPLSFRWRRNGANYTNIVLNSHTSTLLFTNVQPSQAAGYSVVVSNLVGSANTTNATLTVLVDTDGDHVPDDWEVIAGTNPNDPGSYLKIDSLTATNAITLSFQAVSNRTYAVQYRDQLGTGPWTRLLNVPARLTNHTAVIIDADALPTRTYRLATPAPSP